MIYFPTDLGIGSLYSELNINLTPGLLTAWSLWCWPCVFGEGTCAGLPATHQRPSDAFQRPQWLWMATEAEDQCLRRHGRLRGRKASRLRKKRALSCSLVGPPTNSHSKMCCSLFLRDEEWGGPPLWFSWWFFRLRLSPWGQMIACLVSQDWWSTQGDSLVTHVRVGVEFHISHCWKGSVFHPLFILKALFSPSLWVLTGGGRSMNSVFPMVHWSLRARFLSSAEPEMMISSRANGFHCLFGYSVSASALPFHPEIWGAAQVAKLTTSPHK